MKERLRQASHPHYSLELTRDECRFADAGEIVAHLEHRIATDPLARFIATFDHLAHTRDLPDGQAAPDILAAWSVLFCFGITLPDPLAMALRPRSIGVVEQPQGFTVTFLETPMPVANVAMERWAAGLLRGEK